MEITSVKPSIQSFFAQGMKRNIPEILPWPEDGIVVNLGCGNTLIDGATNLDYPSWDANKDPIPFGDGHVDCIHAYHFLEHVDSPIKVMLEIQRVLRVGGVANIVVPYYNSQMQAQDLSHRSMWCEETWYNLFKNPYYKKNQATPWQLFPKMNIIIGIVERNLCLMTQLVKEDV